MAHAACPKETLAMRLRDALGELYRDEQFAALYPVEHAHTRASEQCWSHIHRQRQTPRLHADWLALARRLAPLRRARWRPSTFFCVGEILAISKQAERARGYITRNMVCYSQGRRKWEAIWKGKPSMRTAKQYPMGCATRLQQAG